MTRKARLKRYVSTTFEMFGVLRLRLKCMKWFMKGSSKSSSESDDSHTDCLPQRHGGAELNVTSTQES